MFFGESTSRSQQRSLHFKALNIAFHPFLQKPLSVFLLHSQLPSPWSCVTVPLASDSWVSKSLLSFSLASSCSLRFCSSERAPLPSTSLWLCFTCSQRWIKHGTLRRTKKWLLILLSFITSTHTHTHLVLALALYIAQGCADSADLLQRLLQLQAGLWALHQHRALPPGRLLLLHQLTRQTQKSRFPSWHLKHNLYD